MRSKCCSFILTVGLVISVSATLLAQDTVRLGLGAGLFRLDENTPRLESRGIFVGDEFGKSLTAWVAYRVKPLGYLELDYGYTPVEQTIVRVAGLGGNLDPTESGPAYETPLNIHVMRLQLRRKLLSVIGIDFSIAGGGGLIYIDQGRNHALPGAGGLTPDIEEFDSIIDPMLSVGGRAGIHVRQGFKLTVAFRDNLHFCDGQHDREGEGRYLCTLGTGLNHYEVNIGAEVSW